MFPLGTAMLPGSVLSLHVFEPRYRALVRDCLASDEPEFGVVMITRGREVGGGDVRVEVGAVARMLRVGETPDGRYSVIAGMGRRIRVTQWLPDNPYPYAEVEDWPDDDGESLDPDLLESVTARARRTAALAIELGDQGHEPGMALSDDPSVVTFQLGVLAPLADLDRYQLLCATNAHQRLLMLAEMLDTVEDVLAFRLQDPS